MGERAGVSSDTASPAVQLFWVNTVTIENRGLIDLLKCPECLAVSLQGVAGIQEGWQGHVLTALPQECQWTFHTLLPHG